MKLPVSSSIQKAALAVWPAGRIAARSFNEIPTTRDWKLVATRSSSVIVETSMLRGDIFPSGDALTPTDSVVLSSVQYICTPVNCSVQSFPVIPEIEGTEPVKIHV